MKQKRHLKTKTIALIFSVLALLLICVGGSLAYLVDKTEEVENKFTPSKITTTVTEEIEGAVKKNVKITNTGDTEAYIRAVVVVTWQDESGNVYGQMPVEGTDYTMTWSGLTGSDPSWKKGEDGYYYHLKPIAPDKSTSVLFTDCQVKERADVPDGYHLAVEIIGSGIQSKPTSVVKTNWSSDESGQKKGVTGVEKDGKLQIKTQSSTSGN